MDKNTSHYLPPSKEDVQLLRERVKQYNHSGRVYYPTAEFMELIDSMVSQLAPSRDPESHE